MTFNIQKRTLNKNVSILSGIVRKVGDEQELDPRDLETSLLSLRDCVHAIEELQKSQAHSRSTDGVGRPENGSVCEVLKGQFIHLTQEDAGPMILRVTHTLGRVPQGAIFIQETASNRVFIQGDVTQNIAPATTEEVTFQLNGDIGDTHVCILI